MKNRHEKPPFNHPKVQSPFTIHHSHHGPDTTSPGFGVEGIEGARQVVVAEPHALVPRSSPRPREEFVGLNPGKRGGRAGSKGYPKDKPVAGWISYGYHMDILWTMDII